MLAIAGEARTNYEPSYMKTPVLADQQRLIFISPMPALDAGYGTHLEWWMIGTDGKRESRKSLLAAQLKDDKKNFDHYNQGKESLFMFA